MIFGWPKKKPSPPAVANTIVRNTLRLDLQGGTTLYWWQDDWKGENIIAPWKDFYKWYFGRPQSGYYVIRLPHKQHMIRRADIVRFSVVVKEKKK